MEQSQLKILSEHETTKVIEVWKSYIRQLRGCKRNSFVLVKMCRELEIVHSLKLTPAEIRTIIRSLIRKFRLEKRNISLSGCSLSDWVHYKRISSFFIPRQRLYRLYLEFNGQQRKVRSSTINLFELASQEATTFKKFCAETLELMTESYFVALKSIGRQ